MLVVSLALLATAGLAAANRQFQPKLQPPVMKSLRSNATLSDHQKRSLGVETGSNNYDIQLWENGEVIYHINDNGDETSMNTLQALIDTAVGLWHSSGLPENFKFTKASSDMWCLFEQREKCLVIDLNEVALDETTVGRPPVNHMRGFTGPSMNIDIKNLPNGWTPGAVVAHEIGHAWGLHHEHQNPLFWAKKYNANGAYDGHIFGDANFACKQLPDYGEKSLDARLDGVDPELLCTSYAIAQKYEFSANNFLPMVSGYVLPDADDDRDIDWRSIMMYTTYQTGAKVLSKPDGSDIMPPIFPTTRDVSGLVALYGGKGKKPDTNLLVSPSNPNQASFLKIACSDA